MTDNAQPTTAEVLTKAIEILERDGWCQGTLQDKQGRHCGEGAINRAVAELTGIILTDELSESGIADLAVHEVDRGLYRSGHPTVLYRFNDRDGTTSEDVILTFKRVIEQQTVVTP